VEHVGPVVFTAIGEEELAAWQAWPSPVFDWREVVADFRPYLDRFELAIWSGDMLAALIIGRPSKGNDNLTLHFLERSWANNPLAGWVALIATDAADNYARVLEKQHLVLKNPIPEAIPKYESLGFVVANSINRNTYYRREVKR
jgi:hypothetical protein